MLDWILALFWVWTLCSFIYVMSKPRRYPEGIKNLPPMKVVWMFFWSIPFLMFACLVGGIWALFDRSGK